MPEPPVCQSITPIVMPTAEPPRRCPRDGGDGERRPDPEPPGVTPPRWRIPTDPPPV